MHKRYHFERLPKESQDRVEKAINDCDLDDLLEIYYDYNLGIAKYCCPFYDMYLFFKTAYEQKLMINYEY